MNRIVFILGAGASKEAGGPTMREFLDVAEKIRERQNGRTREHFDLVFKAIAELQGVLAKSALDLDNIEAIFAAFEMAQLFGKLGNLKDDELHTLTTAIKSVIVTTLESEISFTMRGERLQPPTPYGSFAGLLRNLVRPSNALPLVNAISLMTFNYELALDYALHFNSLNASYCLTPDAATSQVSLLKLHGSFNWTQCPNCKFIQSVDITTLMSGMRWFLLEEDRTLPISFTSRLPQCTKCGQASAPEPLIIPPTWNKTQHYAEIKNVWSVAARQLAEAEQIVVIGYSLPDTDQFFRYLYALGTVGPTRLKRFWIINPDPKIQERFAPILGPLAKERIRVDNRIFSEGVTMLREELLP